MTPVARPDDRPLPLDAHAPRSRAWRRPSPASSTAKPQVGAARGRRARRARPPAHRGRPRRRQDHAGARARPRRSAAPSAASSSRSDLLPSDILGVSVFNQETGRFEFRRGPIFANVVLADEINRTTPRTQSSLLEAMTRGARLDRQRTRTSSISRSSSSPRRTRSSTSAPIRCPSRRWIASCCACAWAIRRRPTSGASSPRQQLEDPVEAMEPVVDAADVAAIQARLRTCPRRRRAARLRAVASSPPRASRRSSRSASRRAAFRLGTAPPRRSRSPPAATSSSPTTSRRPRLPALAHRLVPRRRHRPASRSAARAKRPSAS